MKDYCMYCKGIVAQVSKLDEDDPYCPMCSRLLVLRPLTIGELCVKLLALAVEIGDDKYVTLEGCDCNELAGRVSAYQPLDGKQRAFIGRIDR